MLSRSALASRLSRSPSPAATLELRPVSEKSPPRTSSWPQAEMCSRSFLHGMVSNSTEGRLFMPQISGDAREYASCSILVIGGGNSGFDILNHLSRVDTGPLWFSVRRGPSILPRRFGRFAVHRLSPVMARLPTVVVDQFIALTQFIAFGKLQLLGFPPSKADAATRLQREHVAIPVDDGTVAAIRKGRVTVVPEVIEFKSHGVVLANGSEVRPDIVIAASGYGSMLPSLLGSLPVLGDNGSPPNLKGKVVGDVAGLWFTGMTPTLTSFFMQTRREAVLIANGIASSIRVFS